MGRLTTACKPPELLLRRTDGDRLTTTLTTTTETRTEATGRMPMTTLPLSFFGLITNQLCCKPEIIMFGSRTSIHFFTKALGGEGAPE